MCVDNWEEISIGKTLLKNLICIYMGFSFDFRRENWFSSFRYWDHWNKGKQREHKPHPTDVRSINVMMTELSPYIMYTCTENYHAKSTKNSIAVGGW